MFKLVALGVLGYAVYRYFDGQTPPPAEIRLAGGPLSNKATVQSSADQPPPDIA